MSDTGNVASAAALVAATLGGKVGRVSTVGYAEVEFPGDESRGFRLEPWNPLAAALIEACRRVRELEALAGRGPAGETGRG